jgi:formylglycine-generating enzyme required for sulfatase activity
VKEKTANAFGLYDMLGNVWEWVEDCWHANYVGAPSTGEVWSGGDCSGSMLRGASWFLDVWYLRVSARGGNVHDLRSTDGGFRCAQTDFSGF